MSRKDATSERGDISLRPSPMSDGSRNHHHETRLRSSQPRARGDAKELR